MGWREEGGGGMGWREEVEKGRRRMGCGERRRRREAEEEIVRKGRFNHLSLFDCIAIHCKSLFL